MALLPSNLTPAQLQSLAVEYADYRDPSLTAEAALLRARRFQLALTRLQIVRPAEATSGGPGKGAGYSFVTDIESLREHLAVVTKWIESQAAGAALIGYFGPHYSDTTHLQDIPCQSEIY